MDVQSEKFQLQNTLSVLLTDGELDEFETLAGSDVYLFTDKNNRINNNSTTTLKTNVPELIDQSSDTIYYDCLGFFDSRSIVYDISAS